MTDSTKHSSRLRGRKVLVFGGSSGFGYGAAEACIENGMVVTVAASSEEKIIKAVERILKEYPSAQDRIFGHVCNVGDQATLEDNIVKLFEKMGQLDHIIYSAGDSLGSVTKPLDQIDVDAAVKSHMVRYFAPMIIGKHAKKYLSPGPYSSITFTSGIITLRPIPNWVFASGVMHALEGLAQALALELAPIRVNVVQPGFVETEMWSEIPKEAFTHVKAEMESRILTQRLAQPDDIAEAYLYTLKDLNLTGALIKTVGGGDLK